MVSHRVNIWSMTLLTLWSLLSLFSMLAAERASAALNIDISKGGLDPLPIAVPVFVDLNTNKVSHDAAAPGRRIADVVMADLERSGLFRPLKRKSFLQDALSLWRVSPQYRNWRLVGAEAIVSGAVRSVGDKIRVGFLLYDVFQGSLIGGSGKWFTTSEKNWRYIAHRIADEIYSRLTGESGYFASRIAFIAQDEEGRKRVSVMDHDGANRVTLTSHAKLALTPRFSPNGESLFYLSYETGHPRIFRWDLYTGKKRQQGDYRGLNSAPSWSPDGSRMAMTLSKDGNSEIYVKDLKTEALKRLTYNRVIDTSPSWSPDGRRIVFNSNRGGTPQLYIMDADGDNPHRITFEGRYNAAPSWSPRGDWIAFVKGGGGQFRIAVIGPDGRNERVLTDAWMDESPSWSPNGRVILFSRQKGNRSYLYSIDLTGHNEKRIRVDQKENASDPSWSPLIR